MNKLPKTAVSKPVNKSRKPVLGGRETVKVATIQQPSVYLDRAGCVQRACELIREAGAAGAELVAFPEVWLAGYPYWSEGWARTRLFHLWEREPQGWSGSSVPCRTLSDSITS